jgi:hypothetical protein
LAAAQTSLAEKTAELEAVIAGENTAHADSLAKLKSKHDALTADLQA